MTVESVTYISDLYDDEPSGSARRFEGASHLRAIKLALKQTFANINAAVTATDEELNELAGIDTATATSVLGTVTATGVATGVLGVPMRNYGQTALEQTLDFGAYQGCILVMNAYTTGVIHLSNLRAGRNYTAILRNPWTLPQAITWTVDTVGYTLYKYPTPGPTATSGADYLEVGTNRFDFYVVSSTRVVMFAHNPVNMT